jgi:hypothetical protein
LAAKAGVNTGPSWPVRVLLWKGGRFELARRLLAWSRVGGGFPGSLGGGTALKDWPRRGSVHVGNRVPFAFCLLAASAALEGPAPPRFCSSGGCWVSMFNSGFTGPEVALACDDACGRGSDGGVTRSGSGTGLLGVGAGDPALTVLGLFAGAFPLSCFASTWVGVDRAVGDHGPSPSLIQSAAGKELKSSVGSSSTSLPPPNLSASWMKSTVPALSP